MARLDPDKANMILELKRCMAPPSHDEQQLLAEILALPFYEVSRVPDGEMADRDMQPHLCHNNAAIYAALDSLGNSRPVSGWWKRGDLFLFHSVVLSESTLRCVTPDDYPAPLEFAPDIAIEWLDVNGIRVAHRHGKKVPYVVRADPEGTIAAAGEALDALLAGTNPRKAASG